MKTFLDLLDTKHTLTVVVNGNQQYVDLHQHLQFNAIDSVVVDGVEVLPKYSYMARNGVLTIDEPFYIWLHKASAQGWLLRPQ